MLKRNHLLGAVVLGAIGLAANASRAETITINQFFSSAPNAYGSPSYTPYQTNAVTALQNGQSSIGDPATDPTAYTQLNGTYSPSDIMVTGHPSWNGQANPPAPFNNELGNRLTVGAAITDIGGTFDLADVTFALHSSDAAGNFSDPTCASGAGGSLCYEGNLAGTDFSNGKRVGINYGADGMAGGGDDTVYNAGNPGDQNTQINALYYVGIGNAFWPDYGDPAASDPAVLQADIDATADYIVANDLSVSNQYCVKSSCNTASVSLAPNSVPEPTTLSLLGFALCGLGLVYRRRTRS